MILKILGSSSKGNCYLLQGKKESLIIECGVNIKEVKKALNFNLKTVVGCLVTHEHKDHCKYVDKIVDAGIDVYLSSGTHKVLNVNSHKINIIKAKKAFSIGGFNILPFDVNHDCNEPVGFLINHDDIGNLLFATDTYYLNYKFDKLNHILIEANYSKEILDRNIEEGKIHPLMKKRVFQSHFEFENVKEFLKINNLKEVRNIVLLHLSDGNSNEELFKREIERITNKSVFIADADLEIDISLYPF
jgi:phosphoribosyl 1,2-cyclic phosphodiesterase